MTTLLIKNALVLATMDDARREISSGAVRCENGFITHVGTTADVPAHADEVIDLQHKHVLMPGMVNTHHHMVQSLTRAVPTAQNAELFDWLRALYPIWAHLQPRDVTVSNVISMAELMLSGCTTSSDHFYIYPNGCKLDHSIEAAQRIGLRFHATRGAMSVGESKGGLPPDRVVEDEAFILKDMQRLVEQYHDARKGAMLRVALAPCSPFTVSEDLMRESAKLARALDVGLHTHLAETDNDVAYSIEKFGKTPAQYAESLGWTGHGVWHAHCVCLDAHGTSLFARTGTGIAHCPSSNMRLASGIAPVKQWLASGVNVGLGVDGSASNDAGHMMNEARQAMLLARVKSVSNNAGDPAALTARHVLEMATRGGAAVLDRDDIGQIAPGFCADMIAFDVSGHMFAGALHDPLAALVFCLAPSVALSVIHGRVVVREGQLTTLDLPVWVGEHNRIARRLVDSARANV
jgi:8-oxoguanine deaminase